MRASAVRRWTGALATIFVAAGCTGTSALHASRSASARSNSSAASKPGAPSASATSSATTGLLKIPFPRPPSNELPVAQRRALQARIERSVSRDAVGAATLLPGVTAAILTPHGRWTGAAGVDGTGAKLTPKTVMPLAGINNSVLAATALQLMRRGELSLTAPLSRYVRSPLLDPAATVEDVLRNTGGVSDGPTQHPYYQQVYRLAQRSPDQQVAVGRALAFDHAGPKPIGKPLYSDAGFQLVGEAIEKITGGSLSAAVHRFVSKPAGLDRLYVQDEQRPVPPVAYPVYPRGKPIRDGYLPDRTIASGLRGALTMAGDAPDAALLGWDLYGGRLFSPQLTQAIVTSKPAPGYGIGTGYIDLGVNLAVGNGTSLYFTAEHGDLIGYTALLAVDPQQQIAIALLVPDARKELIELAHDLIGIVSS